MQPVDQVDVGVAAGPEERRVARRHPPVPGVAGAIALTQVGLGLDDAQHQALALDAPNDPAAEQVDGDLLAGPAVEAER